MHDAAFEVWPQTAETKKLLLTRDQRRGLFERGVTKQQPQVCIVTLVIIELQHVFNATINATAFLTELAKLADPDTAIERGIMIPRGQPEQCNEFAHA